MTKKNNLCSFNIKNNLSSHPRCSVRKAVLRSFSKFTGKHQCHSLVSNKVARQNTQENTCARVAVLIKLQASASNFIEKETLAQVFSSEFSEISKNKFLTEHLCATASV